MDAVVQLKARSLTTTDLDEAREMLTRQYCSHSIFQKDKRAALDVRYSHSRMLNMSFNTLQYGAEVSMARKSTFGRANSRPSIWCTSRWPATHRSARAAITFI
jgi:hypothetical protein